MKTISGGCRVTRHPPGFSLQRTLRIAYWIAYVVQCIKDRGGVHILDYRELMGLYTHLHDRGIENRLPEEDERVATLWTRIVSDGDYPI